MADGNNQFPGRQVLSFASPLIRNAAWQWSYVAITMGIAVVLPRYMIRKLGDETYGIWILAFSLIEYTWLFDFGLTPAVQYYTAVYHAKNDRQRFNEVVNTSFFFFSILALLMCLAVAAVHTKVPLLFRVPADRQHDFAMLFLMVGIGFANAQWLRVFGSCLEGLQRFDVSNRIRMAAVLLRAILTFLLLYLEAGLLSIGLVTVGCQMLTYWLYYASFRKVHPGFEFRRDSIKLSVLKALLGYSGYALVAGVSSVTLNVGPPTLVGLFRPVAEVGYYNIAYRLTQQFMALVERGVAVVSPKAAELSAIGGAEGIAVLSVHANRYGVMAFLPVTIMLLLYGQQVVGLWIDAATAAKAGPLIPFFALAALFAQAGQGATAAMLFGLNRHKWYSWGLLGEVVLGTVGSLFLVKSHGMLAVCTLFSLLMLINRGIFAPVLICRYTNKSVTSFLSYIFARPLAAAAVTMGAGYLLKTTVWPGRTWGELIAACLTIGMAYAALAFFYCVPKAHRERIILAVKRRPSSLARS
jgi:O-antigen/teichoic acid export membrane protein